MREAAETRDDVTMLDRMLVAFGIAQGRKQRAAEILVAEILAVLERHVKELPDGDGIGDLRGIASKADYIASLGVDIVWKGPLKENDRAQQIAIVEQFITEGINGIVLAPLDFQALAAPVNSASQAGIPTVVIDSDLKSEKHISFVATDNYKGGQMAGRRLAELMGGEIGLYSMPGTGTCVWFTIMLEAQTESSVPAALPAVDNLEGLRICLIDDNATNRSLLQYHASAWKMPYDSAEDGTAALPLLRQAAQDGKPFDLAIIDMHMPGMNGMELGAAIKADPALRQTKLVLLTSLGQRGDAKLAQAAGFSGYLTKPVRKAHLYDCLRLVMGQTTASPARDGAEQPEPSLITRHQVAELHAQVKLLVVDDNPINQKVAVKMLEKLGYHADVAGDGKQALQALAQHSYDLVFMDCQMPEMDGFETTRMIRAQEKAGYRLPIIAMTANAMEGDREHCLSSGMDDFVSKPVKSQELTRVLTQWLNQSDDRAAA